MIQLWGIFRMVNFCQFLHLFGHNFLPIDSKLALTFWHVLPHTTRWFFSKIADVAMATILEVDNIERASVTLVLFNTSTCRNIHSGDVMGYDTLLPSCKFYVATAWRGYAMETLFLLLVHQSRGIPSQKASSLEIIYMPWHHLTRWCHGM